MTMAMLVEHLKANDQAGLGSPGIDELRWLKPVYPGDRLRCESEVLEKRRSASRPEMGIFKSRMTVFNQHDVPVMTFVRAAMNSQRKTRGEPEVSAPEFLKLSKVAAAKLRIEPEMLKRPLNVGFSGGEKKRLEIYQMLMLEPRFMILDETDSGLDIDALKVVAEGVNALRGAGRGMLVITHYQRLLDYIKPDRVHILSAGRIVKSGGPDLALELEKSGYDQFLKGG
jgi:Fe-S cluster assembly ATP-binding protein